MQIYAAAARGHFITGTVYVWIKFTIDSTGIINFIFSMAAGL